MRASTPKKIMRAGFLLFPAVVLAASPAVASLPRCDDPPRPACERVQAAGMEQHLARLERIALDWADQERAEMEQIRLQWVEIEWDELERVQLERLQLEIPDLAAGEMESWVGVEAVEARIAPILEASTRHLASLRMVPEIEKAREASEHLAWKVRERLALMGDDPSHPLSPAIQAFISIAKVPARGLAPLRQALAGVAKAASHVLVALVA